MVETGLVALWGWAAMSFAQMEIDISGLVVDVNRVPVSGAIVAFGKTGPKDTTDADGKFRIKGQDVGVKYSTLKHTTLLGGYINGQGKIRLWVSGAVKMMKYAITDPAGRLLLKGIMAPVKQGWVELDGGSPSSKLRQAGVCVIQVDFDGIKTIRRLTLVPGCATIAGQCIGERKALDKAESSVLAKMSGATINDTLFIVKDTNFLLKKVPLGASVDTLDTLFLYPAFPLFTSADFPKTDGSTSAQPLDMVIACKLLGCSYGWVDQLDGSKKMTAYSSSRPDLADSLNTKLIVHTGTHQAYVNVLKDSAALGLICRPPSPDELRLADSLGVRIDYPEVALDAFVFIENIKNPVTTMTIDEVRRIYTGQIQRWDLVGGWPIILQPYQREANSGSQELMLSLVMKELTPITAPNMILIGMMGPFNRLSTDTSGFCYTVYYFLQFMAPTDNVKAIAIDGVFPDYQNIRQRRYSLYAPVVVVTRKNLDPTSKGAILREWLLSAQGQAVVKESGYVPIVE